MSRRRKVLFLSRWFPFPADNGSKLRIANLLRGLSQAYDVNLISFDDAPHADKDLAAARAICGEPHLIPLPPFEPSTLRARLAYLGLAPRSITLTYSRSMAQRIEQCVLEYQPDIVIASQLGTAIYYRSFGTVPALFEEVELGLVYQRHAGSRSARSKLRNRLMWWKHRRFIVSLLTHFRTCTVVSDHEKGFLHAMGIASQGVMTIPNCIELRDYAAVACRPEPDTLIFTGSFTYDPNYEGMVWFLTHVYPLIKARIPTVKLIITGDHAGRPVLPVGEVILTGHVADVRPLIAAAAVSVVPMLSGGGTRLKILEAMALRTPVVTTHKGAEGLDVRHTVDVLIGDAPEEFAGHVVHLLSEPSLQNRLSECAFRLVQGRYDWAAVMPRFIDVVETVMGEAAPLGIAPARLDREVIK